LFALRVAALPNTAHCTCRLGTCPFTSSSPCTSACLPARLQSSRGLLGAFNWLGDRLLAAAHAARSNTLAGSRRNIEEHYDAGNDMYKLFLDDSMTYSCGIWEQGGCCCPAAACLGACPS
jgi:hypothetical protein